MFNFVFITVFTSVLMGYLFLDYHRITAYAVASFAIQCPQPDIPENGHAVIRELNNMSAGSVVKYQCDVGFILVGTETRTCESSGVWSGNAPVCALNIALYKPAYQSSTLRPEDRQGGQQYYANLSTDGNFEGFCSSTMEEKLAWWQVDLLEMYKIYAVELLIPATSRKPMQELHIVTSSNDDFNSKNKTSTLCYKHEGTLASEWQCGTMKDMVTWGSFGGKCYYGSLESTPWFSANSHCELNGGNLPMEIDYGIHDFLTAQIKFRSPGHAQSYWLGLTNNGKEWQWLNGKQLKNNFWAETAERKLGTTNMPYAAAMTQSVQWNWSPSLQALWYFWICQSAPKFCSSPGVPLAGGVMVSSQLYTVGTTAYYYCTSGFLMEGSTTRTCLENGTWSTGVPRCSSNGVDCGRPDIFLGASVKYLNESTAYGSAVEYQCQLGQKIIGAQIRTCQSDGNWSGKIPRCEDVECEYPGSLERGRVFLMENSTKIGSIAEYTCDVGYGLIGTAVRHCSPAGTWIPAQTPACYDINSLLNNAAVSTNNNNGNADNGYQTSLITGFIVAVVILLIVVAIVVFWVWKKKKLYDNFYASTLYTTTNSQSAPTPTINNVCPHDLLYAFPSTVTPSPKYGAENFYASTDNYQEPTVCRSNNGNNNSVFANNGTVRNNVGIIADLYRFDPTVCGQSSTEQNLHNNCNAQNAVFASQSQFYRPPPPPPAITNEQLKRVVNNINLTLSPCRKQQQTCASAASVFHTIRKMPAVANEKKRHVVDFVRKKLSEVNFNAPGGTPDQTENNNHGDMQIKRNSSPTPSELFSFDDDDDDDDGEYSSTNCKNNNNVEIIKTLDKEYFHLSYGANREPTAWLANDGDTDSAVIGRTQGRREQTNVPANREDYYYSTSETGNTTKIYDLPPDAAAKMNENLAKVLLKQITVHRENVYDTPCPDSNAASVLHSDSDSATKNVPERVLLGNGVEIVHTYC